MRIAVIWPNICIYMRDSDKGDDQSARLLGHIVQRR